MADQVALTFNEAREICKPFRNLRVPKEVETLLNTGKVLFYFKSNFHGWICWPYFPIGKNRQMVKELKKKAFLFQKAPK